MGCYLFVHFIGEESADGEQIYFSVSRDGLHWHDLNRGQPVLRSGIGDRGVRDPFMVRHPESGRFYLIATDLSIFHRGDWDSAQYRGSRDLMVWDSADLVHWSGPCSHTVGVENAGCVWAPEAVWDEEKQAFLVFFASMTSLPGDAQPKQRIFATHTRDFSSFTLTALYAQAENHLIDTTIVRESGWYYRFTKDETTKKIIMERLRKLEDRPEAVPCQALDNLPGVEGPECYQLPDGRWCLIVDQFSTGKGYLPLVTDSLAKADFRILPQNAYYMGKMRKRHGGVIAISEEEAERLLQAFPA